MEIYLDDRLTWAKDIPKLIERLGLIFARLRQFNIILNPEKCRIRRTSDKQLGNHVFQRQEGPSC